MLKTLALSLLGAAACASTSAFADSTQCADATAALKYSAWSYEGGPAPGPGMTVGMTDWSYQGTLLEELRDVYDEPSTPATITSDFDTATKVVLDSSSEAGGAVGSETFAIKVTLTRVDGGPILPNSAALSVTTRILCERSWNYTRP